MKRNRAALQIIYGAVLLFFGITGAITLVSFSSARDGHTNGLAAAVRTDRLEIVLAMVMLLAIPAGLSLLITALRSFVENRDHKEE